MSGPKHIRTPLARVLGRGAAKSGTEHFWHQRLTAVANIPLTIAVGDHPDHAARPQPGRGGADPGLAGRRHHHAAVHRLDHHPYAASAWR